MTEGALAMVVVRTAMGNDDGSRYFFEAGVIKLSESDFNKWKDAYPNINLKAKLLSKQDWASQLTAEASLGF